MKFVSSVLFAPLQWIKWQKQDVYMIRDLIINFININIDVKCWKLYKLHLTTFYLFFLKSLIDINIFRKVSKKIH